MAENIYSDTQRNAQQEALWGPRGVRRQKIQGDVEVNLLGALYPGAYSAAQFGSAMEGQRQNDLASIINMFSPQNRGNMISQFGQQRAGEANDAARSIWQHLSRNAGIGAQQGASIGALNQGRQATTDYARHMNSAEGQQQIAALLTQLYQQAQMNPFLAQMWPILQDMSQSRKFQQVQDSQGGGLLNGLGDLLGSLMGAGALGPAIGKGEVK